MVIVLNGPGSVGKSSVARALQAITAKPFLHVALDSFLAMVSPALFGRPEGLVFEPMEDAVGPCLANRTGPVVVPAACSGSTTRWRRRKFWRRGSERPEPRDRLGALAISPPASCETPGPSSGERDGLGRRPFRYCDV